MARPVIALMSDFGTCDHYVGAMKGVILSVCPDATLVDISHDIPPHDIQRASLELAAVWQFFPPGSVFLVVVDPGVGSNRRGLAAHSEGRRFVAPDNGVLSGVFQQTTPKCVVEVTEQGYALPKVSRTFEGRDRFAPAAAWLAKGIELSALGRPANDYCLLDTPAARVRNGRIDGAVLRIDRFGNLITNIGRGTLDRLAVGGGIEIMVAGHQVDRIVETYADITVKEVCALFGSTDHLEIAANSAKAAERLAVELGAPVRIRRR